MAPQQVNEIRRALLRLFAHRLGIAEADISPRAALHKRFSISAWIALAAEINRLPEVAGRGLRIGRADMAAASSIFDIERALRAGKVKRAARPPKKRAGRPPSRRAVKRAAKTARRKARPLPKAAAKPRRPPVEAVRPGGERFKLDKFSFGAGLALPEATPDAEVAPPPPPPKPLDQAEYKIWYGTSRKPNDPADSNKGYSAKRDSKIHYGTCTVYIPESHKIGSTGSSWWKRLIMLTDDRLKLLSTNETSEPAFWTSLAATLDAVPIDERDALIYVHGYNVTFEDAALRAAQIGFDLSIKGAMAFFSWPSQGKLTARGYATDSATIEANEAMIAEFMSKFASQSHAKAVHIIAHSMGNRGVLRAVNRIAQQAQRASGVPFGQIILAAADVDADTFRNLCDAYAKLSKRATLYVSQRDLAVEASKWLYDFPRVGLAPPIFVSPGIDTINVTNADLTALGHGYVASARDVLKDMHDLIVNGRPPSKRFGLRAMKTDDGSPYWSIGR